MFDFDVSKLLIFGIVALAVIPPKDLPRVMRTVGQTIGKMRRMAAEFQGQFMEAMKEADLESVKQELRALEDSAKIDAAFDPAMAMRQEMTQAVEGPKDVGLSQVALNGSDEAKVEPDSSRATAHEEATPPAAPLDAAPPAEVVERPLKTAERPAAESTAARGAAE